MIPENEAARLEAVRRYEILDTPPDGAFDRVTALAARFFDVPIATVSIVDHDRIWFKSHQGLDAEQTDRVPGLCASAILQDDAWIVENAETDPRTLDNPLVCGELGLRFYCGVPIQTRDGFNLGTLNVIDAEPRQVEDEELQTLRDLAAIVVDELELRMAALREERRLGQMKTDVVTTVSHELRTPLAGLHGAAMTLKRDEVSSDPVLREELVTIIAEQSERLANVIGNVLTASQIETGQIQIVREGVDPVAVARGAVGSVRFRLPEGTAVDLSHAPGVPKVVGDSGKIRQVLDNLIDNAIKYSPGGGAVEVAVAPTEAGVRFSVRDFGLGVEADDLRHVFDKFYRADPELIRGVNGTGLGLFISAELVHAMGGEIGLDSTPGAGSLFWFELPALAG